MLFIRGFKIDQGMQSSTVKSYISAIKKMLVDDGYPWDDKKVLVASLTKACKLVNDRVKTRLPIQCGLLELILFEVQRIYSSNNQMYLQVLYQALFAFSYYGMMRVCEVTASDHVIRARNVHKGKNKDKLRLRLLSSKTHNIGIRPQNIKITRNIQDRSHFYWNRSFCSFVLMNNYMNLRGDYNKEEEQLFVFRDKPPVTPDNARKVLKLCLTGLGLDATLYGMHSFRVGRTTDLIKCNYSLEEVKHMGHWQSNVIYKYIRL